MEKPKVVAGIAGIVIIISVLWIGRTLFSRTSDEVAAPTLCAAQLVRIAEGCAAYTQAHRGQPPPSLTELVAGKYIHPDTLLCPVADHPPGNPAQPEDWSDYHLAPPRSEVNPAKRIVAYCSPSIHDGWTPVVYADGKTDLISPSKLNKELGQ